jgi:hypothetical protein
MSTPRATLTLPPPGIETPAFPGRLEHPGAAAGAAGGGRILAVWATPRSRSTAMLRSLQARGDMRAFFEPFSRSFYASPDRQSLRFAHLPPHPEHSYANILAQLRERSRDADVCLKDMALHVIARADPHFLRCFQHSFLIRHPAATLPSLHARLPDFSFEETGYAALCGLFERVRALGLPTVVLDAEDLVRAPEATLRAYCAAVRRPFRPEALHWEMDPGRHISLWDDSDDWHRALKASRGFQAGSDRRKARIADTPKLQRMLARCLPYYERLRAQRLR